MLIERHFGDAGFGQDFVDSSRVKALFVEQTQGCIDKFVAARFQFYISSSQTVLYIYVVWGAENQRFSSDGMTVQKLI